MSKEHYISLEEFYECEHEGKLKSILYAIRNTIDTIYAKRVIDALRPINAKDPGFKYSCKCNDEETIWLFGYTDTLVHFEADCKCREIIQQNRNIRGEPAYGLTGYDCGVYTACSCMFDQ